MNRATPVQMRKSLEIVDALKRAGIRFVPIPVVDDADFNDRVAEMADKLEEIGRMCSTDNVKVTGARVERAG